jgi:alpha-methylacyl-CoA racemase
VLEPGEAPHHPHNRKRGTFVEIAGVVQPAPAPRFSRTVPDPPSPPPRAGHDTATALADRAFSAEEVAGLRAAKAIM